MKTLRGSNSLSYPSPDIPGQNIARSNPKLETLNFGVDGLNFRGGRTVLSIYCKPASEHK